ncbi:membrane fusion protein, multidrug efflux system [Arboricoccus pini]|uniref:Membrane fusion protein, multidrug efflux system n=1 Tax=Arboricoccus pini TaxID=1963835 RepID=A0A212R3N6_9PROT|nr:efflux RND transporter periplasmic adaptor subunit [Arboricoccus pini]SNB66612.1 membrane fusion protein, multidrug efflux system [Arboricoccus pini]
MPPTFRRRALRLSIVVLLIGAAAAYGVWHDRSQAKPTPPPAASYPVTIAAVTKKDLPIWLSAIGSVQPFKVVDVKVRVDGQLTRVTFTEGQDVHQGDQLAEVDPRPYEAQLAQAEANLARDKAQATNAQVDLTRASKLAKIGAAASQNVDTLLAQVASTTATVKADQAAVDIAKLNLSYTNITSPIDGRTGMREVDAGSILHASDLTGLVKVTQLSPISVEFALSQDDLPAIMQAFQAGDVSVAIDTRDGTQHLADGKLVFIDSQVQAASGQIILKASFANADRSLWPGEFVTARLLVKTDIQATVVPSQAVQRGQQANFVYVVKSDNTIEARKVETAHSVDGYTEVSGVTPQELVVLTGHPRLKPGVKVEPITADGTTRTAPQS